MSAVMNLKPEDFSQAASDVISACVALADAQARGKMLAEAGLFGVLAPASVGGLELSAAFAVPVLESAATHLLAYPLLETLLLAQAFGESAPAIASGIVDGSIRPAIAWAGVIDADGGKVARAAQGRLATHLLCFARDGSASLFDCSAASVHLTAETSLDLDCPEAAFDIQDATPVALLPGDAVMALRERACLMMAAAILGHAATGLRDASDYATQRKQFGKVLAANQAIRHRLARHSLAVETIRSAIARAVMLQGDAHTLAAWAAFSGACDLGAEVLEGAIQVFGGMGFTWDLPLHRHLRRIKVLAAQGNVAGVRDQVAARLVAVATRAR